MSGKLYGARSRRRRQQQKTHSNAARPAAGRAGLRVGDVFEGLARDLATGGEGVVAHDSGRVFFVPGIWPGESGRFRVQQLRGRSGSATLLELTARDAARRQAPCAHHGMGQRDCGGCPWMFVSYDAQLEAKQRRVEQALRGHDAAAALRPIHAAPAPLGYRNRAQFKTDGDDLGFVARGSNTLAPISDCLVLNDRNRHTLGCLRDRLPRPDWRPRKNAPWTVLEIDDEISVDAVLAGEKRPFRQGNSEQNRFMQDWLASRLEPLPPMTRAVELFAGSGNFTEQLCMAGVERIFAIDSFPPAIERLAARALPGVRTAVADLARIDAVDVLSETLQAAQLLLVDPPRSGFRHLGSYLERAPGISRLYYISCDPATFARDTRLAMERGFHAVEIQPLDLFPQTPHVELLSYFERR